jgi:hypothetical protein
MGRKESENSQIEYGLMRVSLQREDFIRLESLAKEQHLTPEELAPNVLHEWINQQQGRPHA